MFWPILYTVLTTIIAFLSLIFSEIKPIIDFGWMMTFGFDHIFYYYIYSSSNFVKFCSYKNILVKEDKESKITKLLGNLSLNYQIPIFIITTIVIGTKCIRN